MELLQGKVAVITGAARGIGAECGRRFARAGAAVVLLDVRDEGAQVCDEIGRHGGQALFVGCDVRDDDSLRTAFDRAATAFGRIDVVVVNAGINGLRAPIDRFPLEAFDELVATNLRGTFLTVRHAVPHLKRAGGSLVLMSSVNGTQTFHHAGTSVYCATKAAVSALARSLALELGRDGIRVNAVCPGHIRTAIDETTRRIDLEPIDAGLSFRNGSPALRRGVADAAEVADVCLFLASELSRHVSGTDVLVDGGHSLVA